MRTKPCTLAAAALLAAASSMAQTDPPMRFVGPYKTACFGDAFAPPDDPIFCPEYDTIVSGVSVDVQVFDNQFCFGDKVFLYDGIIGRRSPSGPFLLAGGGSTDSGLVGTTVDASGNATMGIEPVSGRSAGAPSGLALYAVDLTIDVQVSAGALPPDDKFCSVSRSYNADIGVFGEIEFDVPATIVARSGDVTLFSQFNVGDTVPAGVTSFGGESINYSGGDRNAFNDNETVNASITFGVPDCDNDGIPDFDEVDTDANGTPDDCEIVQNLTQGTGYASLQNAINNANPYDDILIRAGTINEWFITLDKTLNFQGEGAGVTIIDANAQAIGWDIFDSSASFSDITFRNGFATGGFIGGNVFLRNNTDVTFERCEFVDGFCEDGAGAGFSIFGNSVATFIDCLFANNHSENDGGGVWMGGGSPQASFTRCTFDNNSADDAGGGLMIRGGAAAQFDNCALTNNVSVTGDGGAIGIYNTASATLDRCTLKFNTAAFGGAGIAMRGASDLEAHNTLFARGSSSGGAAVEMFGQSTARLINCTMAANAAFDILVVGEPTDTLFADNCIIWGNLATNQGPVGSGVSGTTILNRCIFPEAAGNNFSLNPLFVDPAADDFRVQPGSPAIDAGRNESFSESPNAFDLAGQLRFTDDASTSDTGTRFPSSPQSTFPVVDIGCYEFDASLTGCPENCPADVNGDGSATPADFTAWLAAFNVGCP